MVGKTMAQRGELILFKAKKLAYGKQNSLL